jgi:hypothetical protein
MVPAESGDSVGITTVHIRWGEPGPTACQRGSNPTGKRPLLLSLRAIPISGTPSSRLLRLRLAMTKSGGRFPIRLHVLDSVIVAGGTPTGR